MSNPLVDQKLLPIAVSAVVFAFFASFLSVPGSYGVGTAVLLLLSIFFLLPRPKLQLHTEDRVLVWLLAAAFVTSLIAFLYHGNSPRYLDLPSRYLLLIPVFLLMLHIPPRLTWLWVGVIAGSVSGAAVAVWQTEVLGTPRAVGFTGVIQFGDIGLMLGVFSVAGLLWAAKQQRHVRVWQGVLTIGALAGGYVSIASGSRGGWIALPVPAVLFCIALLDRGNIKRACVFLIAICVGGAVLVATVPTIEKRYGEAVVDIQRFNHGIADTSVGARLAMWDALLIMIPERPIMGWSQKDYSAELRNLVQQERADPIVLQLANTHNNYLELWALNGLPALLAVLALFGWSAWFFCRRLRSPDVAVRTLALCGASLLGAYSVFCMSQIMLGRNNTLVFFLVSLSVLWGCIRKQERSMPPSLVDLRRPR